MPSGRKIPPLALTIGEPAGIGPELAAKAFLQRKELDLPPFVLVGSGEIVRERAAMAGLGDVPVVAVTPEETAGFADHPDALPVIAPAASSGMPPPGKPQAAFADLVTNSIAEAVRLVREGAFGAVVTNPICKETLYEAGFAFPGHTEYLGALAKELWGTSGDAVMMLAGADLRVVPVTVHIPLAEVPSRLSRELIVATVRTVAQDLEHRFGIARPRIAVAGLNPHAGEGGTIGDEELRIIAPALDDLRRSGLDIAGPLPADTMFHARARAAYDAAVCMYHDQALIPIKTIAFDTGVNVTLGLPFVRTSPDHGTAFDIAGTGKADVSSLAAALKLAARLAAADMARSPATAA